tara:strand:- start:148 stop:861 length:714 start_codon:yes stop_codon:yes gene_type:complete
MILIKEDKLTKRLSIIIPTLNESKNLPLLLSDLSEINHKSEILIIDSTSNDKTKDIALINGSRFYKINKNNRGLQLNYGAKKAKGKWLLFIHADSRLEFNWSKKIIDILNKDSNFIYYFKFKVNHKFFTYRFLELFVNLRCFLCKTPYGDQGLLISKENFKTQGGYKTIPLMEDFDFISRINKRNLKSLRTPIFTSGRKWEEVNFVWQSLKNWNLRRLMRKGYSINKIYKKYYKFRK